MCSSCRPFHTKTLTALLVLLVPDRGGMYVKCYSNTLSHAQVTCNPLCWVCQCVCEFSLSLWGDNSAVVQVVVRWKERERGKERERERERKKPCSFLTSFGSSWRKNLISLSPFRSTWTSQNIFQLRSWRRSVYGRPSHARCCSSCVATRRARPYNSSSSLAFAARLQRACVNGIPVSSIANKKRGGRKKWGATFRVLYCTKRSPLASACKCWRAPVRADRHEVV